MSGEDDTLTLDHFAYTESDRFYIFFDKNISIPCDFTIAVEEAANELEKITGLEFISDYEYRNSDDRIDISALLGTNVWDDIDVGDKHVIILWEDMNVRSFSSSEVTILFGSDFDIKSKGLIIVSHELTHVLFLHNTRPLSHSIMEGLALELGMEVCSRLDDYNKVGMFIDNPANIHVIDIDSTNSRKIFLDSVALSDDEDAYLIQYQYGYALVRYLNEVVGEDWYIDFIQLVNSYDGELDVYAEEELLKTIAGDDVLYNVGIWCAINQDC